MLPPPAKSKHIRVTCSQHRRIAHWAYPERQSIFHQKTQRHLIFWTLQFSIGNFVLAMSLADALEKLGSNEYSKASNGGYDLWQELFASVCESPMPTSMRVLCSAFFELSVGVDQCDSCSGFRKYWLSSLVFSLAWSVLLLMRRPQQNYQPLWCIGVHLEGMYRRNTLGLGVWKQDCPKRVGMWGWPFHIQWYVCIHVAELVLLISVATSL